MKKGISRPGVARSSLTLIFKVLISQLPIGKSENLQHEGSLRISYESSFDSLLEISQINVAL